MLFKNLVLLLSSGILALHMGIASAGGKTYTEDEFLNSFSGKSKKVVSDSLGAPVKKDVSVKPSNADSVTGQYAAAGKKDSKPVKVEMWYYKNIVKYDPKRTYKTTELTFVNDRVMNIAFFNNR